MENFLSAFEPVSLDDEETSSLAQGFATPPRHVASPEAFPLGGKEPLLTLGSSCPQFSSEASPLPTLSDSPRFPSFSPPGDAVPACAHERPTNSEENLTVLLSDELPGKKRESVAHAHSSRMGRGAPGSQQGSLEHLGDFADVDFFQNTGVAVPQRAAGPSRDSSSSFHREEGAASFRLMSDFACASVSGGSRAEGTFPEASQNGVQGPLCKINEQRRLVSRGDLSAHACNGDTAKGERPTSPRVNVHNACDSDFKISHESSMEDLLGSPSDGEKRKDKEEAGDKREDVDEEQGPQPVETGENKHLPASKTRHSTDSRCSTVSSSSTWAPSSASSPSLSAPSSSSSASPSSSPPPSSTSSSSSASSSPPPSSLPPSSPRPSPSSPPSSSPPPSSPPSSSPPAASSASPWLFSEGEDETESCEAHASKRSAYLRARATGYVSNEMWFELLGVKIGSADAEEDEGLLFLARIVLRYFSRATSEPSSSFSTPALLHALHSFRCRYTPRVLAEHSRVQAKHARRAASPSEGGSKRSSLSSLASQRVRSCGGQEAEGVPWVILEEGENCQQDSRRNPIPPAVSSPVAAAALPLEIQDEKSQDRGDGDSPPSRVDSGSSADEDFLEDVRLDDDILATRAHLSDAEGRVESRSLAPSSLSVNTSPVSLASLGLPDGAGSSLASPERGEEIGTAAEDRVRRQAGDYGKLLESLVAYHLPFLGRHLRSLGLSPENYASQLLSSAFASCCYPPCEIDSADGKRGEPQSHTQTESEGPSAQPDCLSFPLHNEGQGAPREHQVPRLWEVYAAEVCVQQIWRFLVLAGEPAAPALVLLALLSQQAADLSCSSSPAAAASLLAALSLSDAEADFGPGVHAGVQSLYTSRRAAEVAVSRLPSALSGELAPAELPSSLSVSSREGLATAFRLWHVAALYGVQTPRSFSLRLSSFERAEEGSAEQADAASSSCAPSTEELSKTPGDDEAPDSGEARGSTREPALEAQGASSLKAFGVSAPESRDKRLESPLASGPQPVMAFEAHDLVQALKESARIKCEYLGLLQENARMQERSADGERPADLLVPENFLLAHWPPSVIGIDVLFPALALAAHLARASEAGREKSTDSTCQLAALQAVPAGCPVLRMSVCLSTLLDVFAFVLEAWTMTLIDCRTLEEVERSGFVRLAQAVLIDGQVLRRAARTDASVAASSRAVGDATAQLERDRLEDGGAASAAEEDAPPGDQRATREGNSRSFLEASGLKTLLAKTRSSAFLGRSPESLEGALQFAQKETDAEGDEELEHLLLKCEVARGKPLTVLGDDAGLPEKETEDCACILSRLLIENQFGRVSCLVGGWPALVAAIDRAELSSQLLTEGLVSCSAAGAALRFSDASNAAAGAAAALQEWGSKAKEKARGWVQASASKTQSLPLKWQTFRKSQAASSTDGSADIDGAKEAAPHAEDAGDADSAPDKDERGGENAAEKEQEIPPAASSSSRPLEEMKNQAANMKAAAVTLFSQLWTKPPSSNDTIDLPSSSSSSSSSSASRFSALLRGEGGVQEGFLKAREAVAGEEGETAETRDGEKSDAPDAEAVCPGSVSQAPSVKEERKVSVESTSRNVSPSSSASPSSSSSSSAIGPSEREGTWTPESTGEPTRREKVLSSLLSSTLGGAEYVKRNSLKWKDSLKNINLSRAFQATQSDAAGEKHEGERSLAGVLGALAAEGKREKSPSCEPSNPETDRTSKASRESLRQHGSFEEDRDRSRILGYEEATGAFEVLGDVRSGLADVARLGEAGLLASDADAEDGVFEIGDDEEIENRGANGGFGPVERVGTDAGQDLMLMMKKYEMYIQEIQRLQKGSIIDLVEVQKQIGDLQIFEGLKLRPIKPRWSFTLAEGVVTKSAEKKSLRWLLLTLHQLIVLEPHCSEKGDEKDEQESEGSPADRSPENAPPSTSPPPSISSLCSENGDAERDGRSLLQPRTGSASFSGVAKWSGQWRSAVLSFGEKAKDAFQHNAVVEQLSLQRAGTDNGGAPTFETITGVITLPHATSRRGEGFPTVCCKARVKSNHRLSDLQKALHFPDDAHRLSLVFCNGKSNSYEILARSAFLEAIQNRLASLNIDVSSA
ncbi:conserved hypothetical protein [Neospora caninum Liverpool]|uniref:Uncharacterized protein n=1 Tax=Neospora caninum (strain Liverpool) TaxID=572307 RepID=F0VHU4_NEOCL|nr:conserved hypothetical protein [Neospora caninum Liverpool]CBZ53305.1 conserved hypothetical protein [Neospora caninum Liverpool]|eukprot:XP_003883337.1 conserved hypothetical protein [Neospora caninum Liverpool]